MRSDISVTSWAVGDVVRIRVGNLDTSKGDIMDWGYSVDDYVYARLGSSDPDSDDELHGVFLDEETGDRFESGWVPVGGMETGEIPWERTEPDEDLVEYMDSRDESESLAVLQEEQENLVQMQELRARTAEPGLLHLNVKTVTSAKNSHQWAIVCEHPVVGGLNFYREKPLGGWSDEYDIVTLMESYGIHDGNPYKLQQRDVYVKLEGDDAESERSWRLLQRDEAVGGAESGDVSSGGFDQYATAGVMAAFTAIMAVVATFVYPGFWIPTILFSVWAGECLEKARGV